MKTGCAILVACALLVGTSWGSHGNVQAIAPCRPGFSQSFYTVFVPRGVLQGLNIHKEYQGMARMKYKETVYL
ncbi:cadherin-4-like isoform X1 [Labeo rohita]|uniref:Cadherin-4-like isoform X1 n=1 Tax=Labeo rohita TaxID=84645 RepID=A0A498M0E5_LABRO|nr:cadherin-4-like isoform X1 [Labeo rohita]